MHERERGVILFFTMVLVIVIIGISGPVLMFSLGEAREAIESGDSAVSFYLAESGIEAAKWEIAESQDPDGNGIGNKAVTVGSGSYAVTTTDLGGGVYRVTSTGSFAGTDVVLEEVISFDYSTTFPQGAISIVGNVDDADIDIEKDADIVIDGGDSPALSFTDLAVYTRVGEEFVEAITDGNMPSINLTGSPTNTFPGSDDPSLALPIVHQPEYSDSLKDFTALYNQLVAKVDALRPIAQTAGPTFDATYGSPGSPVTVYVPDPETLQNQTVTGYGTLIIGDELKVENGATLNWTGDIFVVGDGSKDAELKVEGGALNVTGNLVVLGEGATETEFEVKSNGQATINGALFMGSDWNVEDGPEAELEINDSGSLTVNGLMTMIGQEVEIEYEATSNPGNNVVINGMLQIAVPPSVETELEIELEGNVEIHKDDAMIQQGANSLKLLDVNYTIPQIDQLVDREVTTLSWRRLVSN